MQPDRRHFLSVCSAFGLSSTLFPGVLYGMTQAAAAPATPTSNAQQPNAQKPEPPKITKDMINAAATIAGVEIKDEYKDMMVSDLNDRLASYKTIHEMKLPNSVAPAIMFNPVQPGIKVDAAAANAPGVPNIKPLLSKIPPVTAAANLEDICYYSVRQLAELLRTRKITSAKLTDMYLARIKRLDPQLHFVITVTDDRAREQAAKADKEIAAGKYRGPLHGMPWVAKDLLSVKGY